MVVLVEGVSRESSIQAELRGKGELGRWRKIGLRECCRQKEWHSQGSKNEREGARLSGENERP